MDDMNATSATTATSSSPTDSYSRRVVAPMRRKTHEASTLEAEKDDYFGGKAISATAEVEGDERPIIVLHNVHKTYLLGVEGVPALRYV